MTSVHDVFGPAPPGTNLSDNRMSQVTGVLTATLVLAIIAVTLRFYARIRIQKVKLEVDDWTIAGALILVTSLFAATITAGYYGLGKHVWAGTMRDVVGMEKDTFIYALIYLTCLAVVKVSVICFYRRIFGMNWQMWTCLFISIGWGIGCVVALLVACQPISYFWTQFTNPNGGKCLYNLYQFYIGNAAVNVTTDGLILMIPMPIIWRLQMRQIQKILVCGIFCLGGFVCVASIIRICFMTRLKNSRDITWIMSDIYLWSQIEISAAVICSCLPTLQPVLRLCLKTLTRSTRSLLFGESTSQQRERTENRKTHFQPDNDEAILTCNSARVETNTLQNDGGSELEVNDVNLFTIKVQRDFDVREDQL